MLHLRIDAHIDYMNLRAGLASKHVDGRPATQEVQHHLLRHGTGISADSFSRNPMICGKNEDSLAID